jgi:TcpE family
MSDSPAQIRSYQRIFKPDRRIYQIDGRRLPVPGGVPMNWLAWAFFALVLVLILSSRSLAFTLLAGAITGALCVEPLGWQRASAIAAAVAVGLQLCGVVLGWVDWPLRLLILPGCCATAAGQLSPDGRSAHRYLFSRLWVKVRAGWRSLQRRVVRDGEVVEWAPRVWVAPDEHAAVLTHGRVHGPAEIVFGKRMVLVRGRGRHIARPLGGHVMRRGEITAEVVKLAAGQVLEVRP